MMVNLTGSLNRVLPEEMQHTLLFSTVFGMLITAEVELLLYAALLSQNHFISIIIGGKMSTLICHSPVRLTCSVTASACTLESCIAHLIQRNNRITCLKYCCMAENRLTDLAMSLSLCT